MGRISKKLKAKSKSWEGRHRREMDKLKKSFHVPKDIHDVQPFVAKGDDPLHTMYIGAQNVTSVFTECVSALPELKSYHKTMWSAEDEYMPSGPPMSPLTPSYFSPLTILSTF